MKNCVLIRVYDRIEDLYNNLLIIRRTWTSFEYDVVVVANGKSDGYILPAYVKALTNQTIELKENAGHLKGNSQLLLEGVKHIDINTYDNVIILEADTWIYSDAIIKKYAKLMKQTGAVWASARWYDRFYSVAVDFAIVDASFLAHNIDIFNFTEYPECYVYNYLIDKNQKVIYIYENMQVMLPGYIKKYPYAPTGRFYVFLKSKMITHHIEYLKGGIEEKKYYFNVVTATNFFDVKAKIKKLEYIKIYFFTFVSRFFFRRSWYSKRIRKELV